MNRLPGSLLGVGLLPGAPGTWASAVTAAAFWGAAFWGLLPEGPWGRWAAPGAAALAAAALSVAAANRLPEPGPEGGGKEKEGDPGWFVLDEAAGQSVALMGLGGGENPAVEVVLSFVFFRFFDIIKPWPIRKLEELPRGWGVTADDIGAGAAALAVRLLCLFAWRGFGGMG